jgi:poly-gamma-glutamate capsule biosynthesis protein CapA/YwtB (metallophosphatase superfamily)
MLARNSRVAVAALSVPSLTLSCLLAGCAPRPSDRSASLDPLAASAAAVDVPVLVSAPAFKSVPATTLHVLIGGDLLPHRPMLLPVERLHAALDPLSSLLAGADVAMANYETATGTTERFTGAHNMSLAAPAAWLAEAGTHFHAMTVANNHACDLGRSGLEATLAAAKVAGVMPVGGDSTRDPWQPRIIDEHDGRKVCAVAWTTFVNAEGKACKASGELAIADFDRKGKVAIESAVQRARRSGCDGVVAIFHGGKEYVGPIWGVREQSRVAAEAGADAVVVHHPHVPAPAIVLITRDGRKVPVFESVGNLLSNQGESYELPNFPESQNHLIAQNAWTRLGVLADLSWSWPATATAHDHPTFTYGYHLTWTDNDHAQHRGDPMPHISTRPLDPVADRRLIDRLSSDTRGPIRLFTDPCWLEGSGARCVMTDSAAQSAVGM